MKRLLLTLALATLSQMTLYAQPGIRVSDYLYFSQNEKTEQDDIIWFWTGDYLRGPVRTNDEFAFKGQPYFSNYVVSTATTYILGAGATPSFSGPAPILGAQDLVDPFYEARLDSIAEQATQQGHYYTNDEGMRQTRITASEEGWQVMQWAAGVPFPEDDNFLLFETINYGEGSIFVEGRLDIAGIWVAGEHSIGCTGTIRFIDDLQYFDLRSQDLIGYLDYHYTYEGEAKLTLVGNEDLVVANTVANGRGNGAETGSELDGSNKHILISARIEAPSGSFTFENQNNAPDDPNGWDGYWWCDPEGRHEYDSDERGTIFLYGALAQHRRDYVHRTNCAGTGYNKRYLYDSRFRDDTPEPVDNPVVVDMSGGDQIWSDTSIVLSAEQRYFKLEGSGKLTLGPGTHILVEVPEYYPTRLFDTNSIRVAGEEDNPVVLEFHQPFGNRYRPFSPSQIDTLGFKCLTIQGEHLLLDLPPLIKQCHFDVAQLKVEPSSAAATHVLDSWFRGSVEFFKAIQRFERVVFEGQVTGTRILRFANCTFALPPGMECDGAAVRLTLRDITGRDSFYNTVFYGDYPMLVDYNHDYQIFYCSWNSTRSRNALFQGDVSFEGTSLEGVDPEFWNAPDGDYHLRPGSPLIDSGDPELNLDEDGSRSDIGAFPFDPNWTEAPEVDPESGLPMAFGIETLYPNPFNGMTTLSLTLPRTGEVEVTVVDLLGRQVEVLHRGVLRAGRSSLSANLNNHPSGLYFILAQAGSQRSVAKAMLVK